MLAVILSRDRPMQLDGTIRSLLLHCKDASEVNLNVIYKASAEIYEHQYNQLSIYYKGKVNFLKQNSFRNDFLQLLLLNSLKNSSVSKYYLARLLLRSSFVFLAETMLRPCHMMFLVDDTIFVREFSIREIYRSLVSHPNALGFSLRLGSNTNYCYPFDRPQAIPELIKISNAVCMFRWTIAERDFNYPLEISSSIYRVREILPLINSISFRNPNSLEAKLAKRAEKFINKQPFLLCYYRSVTFSNPINRVQEVYQNRAGNSSVYSSDYLARSFEDGYRIDVAYYADFIPNACHQEVKLVYRRS